jgi:hypothetical protein
MRTFANEAERLAYVIGPTEINLQWKQTEGSTDPAVPEVYRAKRQGAGASQWEFLYTDTGGGDSAPDFGDVISASIGADQTDYAPTGGLTAKLWRITPTTATRTINSINFITMSREDDFVIENASTTETLVLANDGAATFATSKFAMPHDLVLGPGASARVFYDFSGGRWRASGHMPSLVQTLTDAATIAFDARKGSTASVTLAASRIIDMTGVTPGLRGYLRVIQDATGGREFSSFRLNGSEEDVYIPGGVVSGLSSLLVATASKSDLLGWFYDGDKLFVWNEGGTDYFDTYLGA